MDNKIMNRRSFIIKVLWVISGIITLFISATIVGAFFAPFVGKKEKWRSVGKVSDFKVGDTTLVTFNNPSPHSWAGLSAQSAAWLYRKSEHEFIGITVNCAHLGCPVRWEPSAKLFFCPCHGGVYYQDGSYAAGPPPHGLAKYKVRIRKDMVELLTMPVAITTMKGFEWNK